MQTRGTQSQTSPAPAQHTQPAKPWITHSCKVASLCHSNRMPPYFPPPLATHKSQTHLWVHHAEEAHILAKGHDLCLPPWEEGGLLRGLPVVGAAGLGFQRSVATCVRQRRPISKLRSPWACNDRLLQTACNYNWLNCPVPASVWCSPLYGTPSTSMTRFSMPCTTSKPDSLLE